MSELSVGRVLLAVSEFLKIATIWTRKQRGMSNFWRELTQAEVMSKVLMPGEKVLKFGSEYVSEVLGRTLRMDFVSWGGTKVPTLPF